ncbi:MAG: hypothetical protein HYW23_04540 [Candidatus Aenigmarchaeota archaeon]|nr:hypothetical protein [Candidatus Aenigmarchaeota archaeon]
MARATYRNNDIDIFLTKDDVTKLGMLETYQEGGKLTVRHKPLELEVPEAQKVVVQQEDFEDRYGTGIKVGRNDSGFYIQLNTDAYWRMVDSLGPPQPTLRTLGGTRYQNADKISFWQEY